MITKVLSQFYIATSGTPTFALSEDAKAIRISNTFDLFVHQKQDGWSVSEGMSGREAAKGANRAEAIKEATRVLSAVTEAYFSKAIAQNINKTGLSPRYKLAAGLTKEQVTANMCLTSETGNQKENKVPRTKAASKTEQAKELRADTGTGIATVQDPVSRQSDLDIMPDANIMTAEDALRIEENIGKSSSNIFKWIMQLFRGRAYVSRGFPTWEAYYADVTGKSRASAYRAVDEAIQKEKLIEMGVPAKFNAKQIAALKPVIEKGKEAVEEVLKDAKKIVTAKDANEKSKSEFHNTGMIPASAIKKAVEKVVPPTLTVVQGGPVDVTHQVDAQEPVDMTPDDPQAQIDAEAATSPVESANPDIGTNAYLMHFAACTWHVAPNSGIPTGCLKVETKEGGYVLVPYSSLHEIYNSWPTEFLTEGGEIAEPEAE